MKNYLGITGCTYLKEINHCLLSFQKYGFSQINQIPALNFLVSYKALLNDPKIQYPHSKRYVSIKDIFNFLNAIRQQESEKKLQILKTIHYNTHNRQFFKEIEGLLVRKDHSNYLYELIDGIQLNIDNPSPYEINLLKKRFPNLLIIIQFNLFEQYINLDTFPKDYSSVSHILIDSSKGTGSSIDLYSSRITSLYKLLYKKRGDAHIGFAGGFNGENIIPRIKRISQIINTLNFNIDAEGCLRDKDDNLNLNSVDTYVRNYIKTIKEYKGDLK